MIDIHTHILPGLDDGAESTEDAVQIRFIQYRVIDALQQLKTATEWQVNIVPLILQVDV
jgi:tyrosine-protein phosphatase YwqE